MKKRQTVVEHFSTLLDAQEDNQCKMLTRWQRIPLLENNMRRQVESFPSAGTKFWLRYWLSEARTNSAPFPAQHLQAALQESCFWAARKIGNQLPTQGMGWLDYLQIAQIKASDPVALFKKYDDSRGMSLESYGQFQLERTILDTVRKGNEAAGYSSWGLLRAISKKALKGALQQESIQEPQLSHCLLAWQCFKEIYTPSRINRQLQEPKPEEYSAFAELYNQLRFPHDQEPALSSSDIKTLLQTCIRAARASTKTPPFIPLEYAEHSAQEPKYSDQELPTPEEQAEMEEQWQRVRAVLAAAIAALPESGQTMLRLWHGLGLKQQDIGRAMSLRQYQVSRKLQEYKKLVLQALVEWSRTQMQIGLSVEEIDKLGQELNPWLDWYCRESCHEFLQTTLLEELGDEIPLLQRYYGEDLPQMKVASELNLDATTVNQRLEQVKQHLQLRLYNWVKDTYNLSPDALNSVVKPIAALVEAWLTNARYSTFAI